MTISNYTDLQTEVLAYSNRSDLSARVPTFIQLAEEEMKRELKLSELETSASVTISSGVGALPTGYVGARSVYWDGDEIQTLQYVTPDRYNKLLAANSTGTPRFYTIQGGQLKILSQGDGTVVMQYRAKLTALSDSNLTNAVITEYPDAYFNGTMAELFAYTRNDKEEPKFRAKFDRVIARIKKDQQERKYPNGLEVRAA